MAARKDEPAPEPTPDDRRKRYEQARDAARAAVAPRKGSAGLKSVTTDDTGSVSGSSSST